MRDYAKVGPQFWIGKTGKMLRRAGVDSQLVGLYLLTSPHANMLGLYYLAQETIAHETGLGLDRARTGLKACVDVGFCSYDTETEMVWVHEMAFHQIAEKLSQNDKQVKGVQNEYGKLPDNPFLAPFFEKYSSSFWMTDLRRGFQSDNNPFEGASKGHRSQEQEQEQEQKQEQEQEQEQGREQKAAKKPKRSPDVELSCFVGIDEQIVSDFKAIRKAKGLPITKTAMDGILAEAAKASMDLETVLRTCCIKGWAGFSASWLTKDGQDRRGTSREPDSKYHVNGLDHSSTSAAMAATIQKHNIVIPDGDDPIEF